MWPWRAGGERRLLFMSGLISHPFLHTLPSPWPSKVSSAFTDFETLHSVAFFSINLLSINYNNIWYMLMLYLSFSLLNPFIWTKYKDFYLLPTCCLVTKSCPTLCDSMVCSTLGFRVLHHLLEFAQTYVHWVSDAVQPSYPLSLPSPSALSPSQHQCLFQWVGFFVESFYNCID